MTGWFATLPFYTLCEFPSNRADWKWGSREARDERTGFGHAGAPDHSGHQRTACPIPLTWTLPRCPASPLRSDRTWRAHSSCPISTHLLAFEDIQTYVLPLYLDLFRNHPMSACNGLHHYFLGRWGSAVCGGVLSLGYVIIQLLGHNSPCCVQPISLTRISAPGLGFQTLALN